MIKVVYELNGGEYGVAYLNPNSEAVSCPVPENAWVVLFDGETYDPAHSRTAVGTVEVPARAAVLLIP